MNMKSRMQSDEHIDKSMVEKCLFVRDKVLGNYCLKEILFNKSCSNMEPLLSVEASPHKGLLAFMSPSNKNGLSLLKKIYQYISVIEVISMDHN